MQNTTNDLNELLNEFHSKFENPGDSESYDTHEGGYLNQDNFVDTDEAISEIFKQGLSPKIEEELKKQLNNEAFFWKRKEQ